MKPRALSFAGLISSGRVRGQALASLVRIKNTGAEVREATAEVEPSIGTMVQVFTTGTMVQVFLRADILSADTWNGNEPAHQS